jgi:hypothetical protein
MIGHNVLQSVVDLQKKKKRILIDEEDIKKIRIEKCFNRIFCSNSFFFSNY